LNLSDSHAPALEMLHRMEQRFDGDDELETAYNSFLEEYENLGHMIRVQSNVQDEIPRDDFFLPHHGVWKESSETTKLRTVFNGSI